MALKKPSDLFDKTAEENNIQIIESDNTLREELVKVENLSEQVIQLQQELSQKVIKNDLESLVLSQINSMQENFDFLQNDFKKSNKKDIVEFKKKVSELTEIVGNLVENELPKYRKQVTKNEVVIDEKFNKFIIGIRNEIDTKVNDIAEVIDTNLEYFNTQLQETSSESKNTSDTYNKLSKIVENRISKENNKLDEYSQVIRSLHNSFVELEESLQEKTLTYNQIIEEKFETISSDVKNTINSIDKDVDTFKTQVSSDILSIKADVVINEQHIKNVDKYLQNHHQKLVELKEEVFGEIGKLTVGNLQENLERLEKKIDYIKETYSKIEPEVIVKEVIKEGLLNEPPDTKNSDPLTPLDQKFVTLDQLQQHYRLFINRIQQQISTIGGGGETRLKYLDDIVGIATNASAYDGKYLKYNHSLGKFEFTGDITLGTSGINSITSTTDIQSWYYTNKSKSVSGDDTAPAAVYVGAAGTAMFIVGDTNNRIIKYTLSTPYDVSTAGVAVTFFSTATQETIPTGIDFNPTGTKMFISGQTGVAPLIVNGDYVHEYSLSTPWNIAPTSVGYTTSYNVIQDATPNGVTFGDSGSKMYVVGATNDAVYQYSLSTPYSLASGVTYDNISLVIGTNPLVLETLPSDISFNSTGTVLWVVGNTQDRIYEFRLGTAWNISTAVFYDDVYVGYNETGVTGLHVIPEQNVAYIVGTSNDTVFQYSTNTPAIQIASSGISSVSSIVLNNETRVKDKLYVKGFAHFDTSIVTQGNVQVDGTLTVSNTLTANSTITLSGSTTGTIALGANQTTGTLTIGGATQTGAITLGQATTTQTVGIATGITASGNTKTINLGTGGASGSLTQINIGPTAGVGTVTIGSGTNLGIGGVTNPSVPLVVSGTSRFFTAGAGDVTITHSNLVSTIRGASTVQLALGANNTDVIRINNSGLVGIGTTNPVATLQVKDALAFETTNTTTTSTSQVAVDTFATATFRSAKYQVQMTCPGQLATLGGITTGGSGYTAGTFNVTFSNSSGTGAAAQGTLTISNGTVSQIGVGTTGGSGYTAGDVLTAAGGSGLQVSVASTASPSGRILTLGAITSAGIGYTSGVGVGTTTLTFLGGTGTGAVGLATIFDGVITSATLLQQPTTGTGGTVFYSGSNYTTSTVLTIAKTDVTNTITDIAGSVGVSTFTSLTAHGIGVSDTVRVSSTSNGLTAGTNYFVVTTPTTTTFTLGSSVGIGTTFTTGSSLSIGFYRNSANAGGSVAYLNAITGISTNYQVSDLMVLQNGTTADFVEYGTIANNDILGTFAADISGANTRLLVTPTYATNTVKVARQAITV